jgi:hypothetical protein
MEGRSRPERDVDLKIPSGSPWDQRLHPYLARQLSTKDARQSTEWYTHDGILFERGARDQKLDGNRDTRHKI